MIPACSMKKFPLFKVAVVQMASSIEIDENLHEAAYWIAQATEQHASLIVLPENFAWMGADQELKNHAELLGDGKIQQFLSDQAKKHQIWLLCGTIPIHSETDPKKVHAASLLFNPQGKCVLRYDKHHLFDVVLDDGTEYRESSVMEPGEKIGLIETPFGKIGIAICYDLRFPELFRHYVEQGVEMILVPAAFTATTGAAHWETLLRARAIENQVFIVAANQGGTHFDGRTTFGNSMIVDPWGHKLNECEISENDEKSSMAIAEIDRNQQQQWRNRFPVLEHRRIFCSNQQDKPNKQKELET